MRSRGFTLVELIATMVILGIISVMTSKFIVNGFSFYVDATNIQKISTTANFVAEKMEKLIENSVPNSIVISEKSITFVPIKGALGYTYIPKNPLSAFDNKPVLYAVTTAFDRSNIKKGAFVAFNNYGSNEEYYEVLDVTVNGNVTAVTIDAPSSKKFTPGSERGRLYFVDGKKRYITVKLEMENSQLVIIEHNGKEATGTKNILARDVSDIRFSKVAGAFNQYGEIEIEYRFPYQNIAYEKSIYQRIGVANAP